VNANSEGASNAQVIHTGILLISPIGTPNINICKTGDNILNEESKRIGTQQI